MSNETTVAIVGAVTFAFGGAGAYIGIALIRNFHHLNDRLLRNYADRPGGWQRSDRDDSSHSTQGIGFNLSFEYVPKTPAQVAVTGWVLLLVGLLIAATGVLLVVAGLLGQVQ